MDEGVLRVIPSVSALLALPQVSALVERWGHDVVVQAARAATDAARLALRQEQALPLDWGRAVSEALERLLAPSLRPVINASGVIIHTNLGRAPLASEAIGDLACVASGYCNLEYDLDKGSRGSRYVHAEAELCDLTGAEAAVVVNNNAAAVLLALTVLAQGREVIISRGQLVEIGGGFRVPEVMAQSGARLVEVGTTNRTYVEDYTAAIGADTALLLFVHRSNFHLSGFVHEPTVAELAMAARRAGLPLYVDLGSGALRDTAAFGLAHEPMVQESLTAGADIVSFSGDKLLGGPQAGIIVGRQDLMAKMRQHPLMRALRVDKLTLAALQATLRHYRRGTETQALPVWRMIAMPLAAVEARARHWQEELATGEVRHSTSAIGGGSLPGQSLPTAVLALAGVSPQALVAALRAGNPPVIARVEDEAVVLDPRTVMPDQDEALLAVVRSALPHLGMAQEP
ncbi:MAG: L-seryl-tRNA(Sec) selenium transferase [Anaerolineae bacterium]